MSYAEAISAYVGTAGSKLAGGGQSEANIRGPVEQLIGSLAESISAGVVLSDEHAIKGVGVRPDWSAHVQGALVGYVEAKQPGKGAEPKHFSGHDARQWEHLRELPNLLLTDGLEWALYRDGQLVGPVIRLEGSLEDGTATLADPEVLVDCIEQFVSWEPLQPRSAEQLAEMAARLCRLLRREVADRMAEEDELGELAADWRELLFAEADDATFADGFAQTVTFSLLLARVEKIQFTEAGPDASAQLQEVAHGLEARHALIGTALGLLTYPQLLARLGVSVEVLLRVIGAVDWAALTGEDPDAWLLFYEQFLSRYDPTLRRKTGSYYTEQPLVDAIVSLVDELVEDQFSLGKGLASPEVRILDPAMGTGTFLLSALRTVAKRAAVDGSGKVPAAVDEAAQRIHGFELQVGPYTVAEMRLAAELVDQVGDLPPHGLGVYVTNTLEDHRKDPRHFGHVYAPLTASQRAANKIKGPTPLLVVIGNPPYRERSHSQGAWVEAGDKNVDEPPLLSDWLQTDDKSVEPHLKHLYNPYVYFWRWAAVDAHLKLPRAAHRKSPPGSPGVRWRFRYGT